MWCLTIISLPCCTWKPERSHLIGRIFVKYSSEVATTKDVDLADTWLNGQSAAGATDQLSDPFEIVTDHKKRPRTDTPGYQDSSPTSNIHTSISEGDNLHRISFTSSQQEKSNQSAANYFVNDRSWSSNRARDGAHTDTIGSTSTEALQMPARMNPHENGLCRYPHLREQRKNGDFTETKSPYCLWHLGSYKSITPSVFASSTSHKY